MNGTESNKDEVDTEKLFSLDGVDKEEFEKEISGILNILEVNKLITQLESDENENMTLSEFVVHHKEHETNSIFDAHGDLNIEDVISIFTSLGVNINKKEAIHLFKAMRRNDLIINHKELLKRWEISTHYILENPDHHMVTKRHEEKWWSHLIAGGIAGAVSRTFTAPLDRLKIFLQVHPTSEKMKIRFKKLLEEGGISGLWRGNCINVIKIAPETAIKFATYDHCKKLILGAKESNSLDSHERFISGSIAGIVSQSIVYPLEVVKTKLALGKTGQYSSITDAAKKMFAREGIKCFYKGYVPNLLGIIPYAGIDLTVYETLKQKYMERFLTPGDEPGMLALLGCGSVSCTIAQSSSYPLALVRTRLQVLDSATIGIKPSMLGVFSDILQKEGVKGLYRGITPNLIKVIPAVSISYVVYEYASRHLGVKMT